MHKEDQIILDKLSYSDIYPKETSFEYAIKTSFLRSNLINWIDIRNNSSILYISNDSGALVPWLTQKAKLITVVELNEKNISYTQKRFKNINNVIIKDEIFYMKMLKINMITFFVLILKFY